MSTLTYVDLEPDLAAGELTRHGLSGDPVTPRRPCE
jgi:hypothetical protein